METGTRRARPRPPVFPISRLSSSQVNLLLEALLIGAFVTGVTSWAVGTGWARWWTVAHAMFGLTVLVLAPAKLRRSVRTGMRRRRATRWLSIGFGVLVIVTVALGFLHATGLWFGVGYWTSLWTHFLAAFVLVPLLIWHVVSRPVRPRKVDADRRMLLGGATAAGIAAVVYGAQETMTRVGGLAGGDRRFSGSHEIGSFDPDRMPTVQWFDDSAPSTPPERWELRIAGQRVELDELRAASSPVEASVDCTGGWWSKQSWDAVALSALVDPSAARSIRVTSATGYSRLLPSGDADHLYLAIGYGGRPLRRGLGAPVRIVPPGPRGPWWVKWVTEVDLDDRPWWLQLPFPPT